MTEVINGLASPLVLFFFGLLVMERVLWAFVIMVRFIRQSTGQPQ